MRIATRTAAAGIAVIALLGGCTTNPFTGEKQVSKTAKGAAIGAGAGAAIGAISGGDRAKRALIGAGVGALAGGAVGAYMDAQESKLRAQLEGTGVSVTRVGDSLVLNMPGNVTFDTDRADIRAGFYDVLNSVALVLKEFDKTIIEVAGHTDSTGSYEHNQDLSERRADSVAQYLRSQGIDGRRILSRGFGEMKPIATNATPAGREQNRRVQLTLVPLTA
ncbi:MAG: OmpA family protein [Deltaproteobacteria bacterium]|nr:MAG: OmpA family protein [Deltaproteobacteria bacterium]